jgi:hypothetical protein
MKAHGISEKEIHLSYFPRFQEYHPEYPSIIRHMYDWIVRMIPEKLTKIHPSEIWVVAVLGIHHIYEQIGEKYLPKDFHTLFQGELR